MAQDNPRQIKEEQSFAQCVERLGGAQRIDKALTALWSGLAFWPEGFDLVGEHGVRIAKTDEIVVDNGADVIPRLRLYFRISDLGEVILLWIEEIPEDEVPS